MFKIVSSLLSAAAAPRPSAMTGNAAFLIVERTLHRRRRPRRGQQLDRPVEGELNESTRQAAGWLGRGRGRGG
jgi:hypothetical protein